MVLRNEFAYSQSRVDHALGFLAASVYSLSYYVVPGWFALSGALLLNQPGEASTWAVTAPIILSALLPPMAAPWLLRTRAFKQIPAYFRYKEVLEIGPDELRTLIHERPTMISLHPHGVFSMAALCAAVQWSQTWWSPAKTPTAVASAILQIPLLKHVVGTLGITSASSGPLVKALSSSTSSSHGVILYPGGTSELFLADPDHERLYLLQRKGFIRIALMQGAALVPGYLFGNTRVLKLLQWPVLRYISRKTGVALTYLYGRFWLPMPLPAQCMTVLGKPILLPRIEAPTAEQVDHWHGVYVGEVRRIFDEYTGECEGYAGKVLEIE